MKRIDKILTKKRTLLSILEEVQKEFGYLPKSVLKDISKKLKIPLSKIYGMSTFYFLFSVKREGKNIIRVCNSPSCYINGSLNVLKFLKKQLKINVGQTTKDRKFSLELTPCIGCCDKAPAMMVNDKIYGNLTEEKIKKILKKLK
jgi:NADH-quinone oxidoreductase subunit E